MNIEWSSIKEFKDIKYEKGINKAEGINKITINRPEVRNAFRPQTVFELKEAFTLARDDHTCGVIILTGEGKKGYSLRINVSGGGCSGMSYNLTFDNNQGEFDKTYKCKDITIVCDVKSWFYVKGTEIDFSDDMLSGGFKLNNPNANRTCGCGTSFSA